MKGFSPRRFLRSTRLGVNYTLDRLARQRLAGLSEIPKQNISCLELCKAVRGAWGRQGMDVQFRGMEVPTSKSKDGRSRLQDVF